MSEETINEAESGYKELLNMKLNEVLATIAYNMEEDGAKEGDVGKLVFENEYYAFSVTVIKKED